MSSSVVHRAEGHDPGEPFPKTMSCGQEVSDCGLVEGSGAASRWDGLLGQGHAVQLGAGCGGVRGDIGVADI